MAAVFNEAVVCPIMIGRAQHATAFHQLIDQVKTGSGRVALLSGEAGIGKSRLTAEVKAHAAGQGFALLQGGCFETDRALPYAPFLDPMRSLLSAPSSQAAGELAPLAHEISHVLPDVAPLTADLPAQSAPPALDPQWRKRRLFDVLRRLLVQQSARQPLLFVVEDVHWSDDTSLELLLHLARGCAGQPILFLLTYRDDEVTPELRHFLAQLDREHLAADFTLRRLGRAEVSQMLHTIFALHQAIPTGLVEHIYLRTDGNPFFIEEVLKSLIVSGEIIEREGVWERALTLDARASHPAIPRSVQDAVYQRTSRLSAPARQVLTLAAVAGRHFDLRTLQQIMQVDVSRLLVFLKELVAAQLVTEEAADLFAFRHALTREAVYAELLASERQLLHRTIAETIERHALAPSVLDARLTELAYHFYEGADWSKAAEYGQRAGERALTLHAPRAAIEHLTRALSAIERMNSTPPGAVLRARGQAYETLGEFMHAREDYERALEMARQTRESFAEWQSLLDIGFLWAGRDYAQAGDWFRKALALAEALGDPHLHARSLNRLGNWLVNTGHVAEGLHAHQEALDMCEALHDIQSIADTLDLLGMASGIYGDTLKAVEHYDRAIAAQRSLDDQAGLISSLVTRVGYASPCWAETTFSICESLDRCSRDIAEAIRLAQQGESLTGLAFAEWSAGMAYASFGELGRGLAHSQEALRISTEIEHVQWRAGAYCTLGRVYLHLLEANLAVKALEAGLALATEIGSAWWIGNVTAYLARAYLLQGAMSRAESVLAAVMAPMQPPASSPERRVAWAWGELALARDEPALALSIADQLLASAPGAADARLQPIPWILRLKGEALGALQRREEAIQTLEAARRGARARHEQPLLWQIERALGRQYRRLKQEEPAARSFASARQGIAALAGTLDDAYLREHFVRAAHATLPKVRAASTMDRAAKAASGGLTARELEVVTLIAQGKSNREIAEALVVTKRTVETHINNILSKLNLTSRAQLVLWAVGRGLVAQ